jgi:hypothetical protein
MKPTSVAGESANSGDQASSMITSMAQLEAVMAKAGGVYHVECRKADGSLRWADEAVNAVTQEGKVCALKNALNASAFTQTSYLGLIASTNYASTANTNTAANISTSVATNGWQEAPSSVVATRGTPSWGTSTGAGGNASLATTAISFSILAAATLKGCFLVIKDLAGAGPSSAAGNTTGALYSAGTFTGGDKVVGAGDTLNVTYTASLT